MDSSVTPSAPVRRVDPSAIERELSALWMAEGEVRKQSAEGKTLTRTVLLNLVIFAPDQAAADRALAQVVALTGRQPSRSILMVADERASDAGLDAWVSLFCTTPLGGGERVCGEQIVMEAKGPAILDLPGTVLPLLLTNVPTFLWWLVGNPFAHPIYENLVRAVDRVILDSLTFTQPQTDFADAARHAADGPAIVTDLGWARLAPWRSLIAQVFDPRGMRPYLNDLERVRLTTYTGSPALAWLFAGWLASRLDWRLISQDAQTMRFEGGQTIEFERDSAGEADRAPGYFAAVHLRTRDSATFEVARLPKACAVTRLNVGGMQTEHVVPVRYDTPADWLGRELNRLARSATFEAAISLISNLG